MKKLIFLFMILILSSFVYGVEFPVAGEAVLDRGSTIAGANGYFWLLNYTSINSTEKITKVNVFMEAGAANMNAQFGCHYESAPNVWNLSAWSTNNVTLIDNSGFGNYSVNISGCQIGDSISWMQWSGDARISKDSTAGFFLSYKASGGCDPGCGVSNLDNYQVSLQYYAETTAVTNSSWNVTSKNLIQGQDSTAWNTGGFVTTTNNKLSGTFTTSENTNCSGRLNVEGNYSQIIAADPNFKFATTDTTSHSFNTIPSFEDLPTGNNCFYVSCIRSDGSGESVSGASTSSCLNTTRVLNISVDHFEIEIDEVIFNTPDYIFIANESFNLSTDHHLTFKGAGQLRKETSPLPSVVSMRLKLNGKDLFDKVIRTVSDLNDRGVFSIPINHTDAIVGQNNLTIEIKEDGIGSVNLSSFELSIDTNTSVIGTSVCNEHLETLTNFSSLTYVNIANFSWDKDSNSSTLLDYQHTLTQVLGSGSVVTSCFLQNNKTLETTPTYSRYISSAADTGSSGMNYRSSSLTDGSETWGLFCKTSDSDTVQCDGSMYFLEMADDNHNIINGFQNQTVTTLSLTGSDNIILSYDYTVQNTSNIEILTTTIIQSTTGTQNNDNSPIIKISSPDLSQANCFRKHQRSLDDNNDIGTIKFYAGCKGFNPGDNITFRLSVDVAPGETLNILNASMSSYEINLIDTTQGAVAPQIIITDPTNLSEVQDLINITASISDLSGFGWQSNISLLYQNRTFAEKILSETSKQNISQISYFDVSPYVGLVMIIEWNLTDGGIASDEVFINVTSTPTQVTPVLYNNTIVDNTNWFNNDALDTSTVPGVMFYFFIILIIVLMIIYGEYVMIGAIVMFAGLLTFFFAFLIFTKISVILGIILFVIAVLLVIRSISIGDGA